MPQLFSVRFLVKERIGELIAVFDAHDAGIYRAEDIGAEYDRFACPNVCGFVGTEPEWRDHLAGKLADVLVAP